ncbi:MAG: hypothetical protein O7C75_19630 [Verrucomicrobia bacterium]|nr:hypothetical protein [Verrucomicrobiota bacterium]
MAISHASLKQWFARSHLFMLLFTQFPSISGFNEAAEHPIYGPIRIENRPEPHEVVRNLSELGRTPGFRDNTIAIVRSALRSGAQVLLATFARSQKQMSTRLLPKEDPMIIKPLAKQLHRNNEVLRELASEYNLILSETGAIGNNPEIFYDDCHVNAEGHAMRALILLDTLRTSGMLPTGPDSVSLPVKQITQEYRFRLPQQLR